MTHVCYNQSIVGSDKMVDVTGKLADDALHVLHGARQLLPPDALKLLSPLLSRLCACVDPDCYVDAARAALTELINSLKNKNEATNDIWLDAIETTVSLANATSD